MYVLRFFEKSMLFYTFYDSNGFIQASINYLGIHFLEVYMCFFNMRYVLTSDVRTGLTVLLSFLEVSLVEYRNLKDVQEQKRNYTIN